MVSLNPIMVDGTGMCGACRVTVNGVTRFGCVDGPEFDGHAVNFDELIQRQRAYLEQEKLHGLSARQPAEKFSFSYHQMPMARLKGGKDI